MEKGIFFSICVLGLFLMGCSSSEGDVAGRKYRVARDHSWTTLSLMGKSSNLSAFSDSIIKEIAKLEGIDIEVVQVPRDNLLHGLKKGEFDAILSEIYPMPFREESHVFSEPYFFVGPVLVVPESSSVRSLEEMGGKQIAVMYPWKDVFQVEQYSPVIIKLYDSVVTALEDMDKGTIDGVVMDLMPAHIFCNNIYKGKLKVVSRSLTSNAVRLLAKKDSSGEYLVEHFNEGYQELKDSGKYDLLIRKWGLDQ